MKNSHRKLIINTITLFLILLSGCLNEQQCYFNDYTNITSYEINITGRTEKGIYLDDPKGLLDPEKIDKYTTELEECLGVELKPDCLIVKVPPDLYQSKCTGKWLFPCGVGGNTQLDPRLCREKGLEPTAECPCHCRGAIQDENVIVINTTMETFKGELARMLLGVNNPWVDLEVLKCL